MSAKSRRKGKNGELEAAMVMSIITGTKWIRTAQRNGKNKADVEPEPPNSSSLHVEVKRYQGGLEWWTRRVRAKPKTVFLSEQQGIYFCGITAIGNAVMQDGRIESACTQRTVAHWLAQAYRDAAQGCVPMVLCRQDDAPWIIAWRHQDDDILMAALIESGVKRCVACVGQVD